MEEQCNLPAPDSFRITQTGGEFINLAWKPVFPGATHQLTIMESDGAGGYVTILVENHVPGDTYIADDLLPGTGYRFVLATKCPSGDPSEVKTIIDGITLIVDLTILGRQPVNPSPTSTCEYIPLGYNWVGFKVIGLDGDEFIESDFELVFTNDALINSNFNPRVKVKRVGLFNQIVASDEFDIYPKCNEPTLFDVSTKFKILKLIAGGPNKEVIGYVNLSLSFGTSSFSVCPDLKDMIFPWKPNFDVIPIVSQKSGPPQLCPEDKLTQRELTDMTKGFYFLNPFNDHLAIKIDKNYFDVEEVNLMLIDMFGRILIDSVIDISKDNEHYVSSEFINSGVYTLVVNSPSITLSKTIIKH